MRRRITRKQKHKKQKKLLILSTILLSFTLITAYSAFSTKLSLTAKGNIKDVYHTITFKTQLLENNTFEDGTNHWKPAGATIKIDDSIKYNGYKAMQITTNATTYQGVSYTEKLPFKKNKKYEQKAYLYFDDSKVANAKYRVFRVFNSSYKSDDTFVRYYHSISTNTDRQKSWFVGQAKFTTPTVTDENYFSFTMNFLGLDAAHGVTDVPAIANIYVSLPSFYEIEEKEIKKYTKINNLPIAQKESYTFEGWYTEEFGGEKVTEDTEVTKDLELYAHFIIN